MLSILLIYAIWDLGLKVGKLVIDRNTRTTRSESVNLFTVIIQK